MINAIDRMDAILRTRAALDTAVQQMSRIGSTTSDMEAREIVDDIVKLRRRVEDKAYNMLLAIGTQQFNAQR